MALLNSLDSRYISNQSVCCLSSIILEMDLNLKTFCYWETSCSGQSITWSLVLRILSVFFLCGPCKCFTSVGWISPFMSGLPLTAMSVTLCCHCLTHLSFCSSRTAFLIFPSTATITEKKDGCAARLE